MTKQDRIVQRQNSSKMLKYQYAARYYYNRAARILLIAILLSFINLVFLLNFNSNSVVLTWALIVAPFLIDLLVIILYKLLNHTIRIAADLRNLFDEKVLDLKVDSYDRDERDLLTFVDKSICKNAEKASIQMKNTGHDNPPGVKEWYEFFRNYPDNEVVFECQRQNHWWNKKMLHRRAFFSVACFLSVLAIALTLCIVFKPTAIKIVPCFFGAVLVFAERIGDNIKYIRLSVKIDDYCESYSHSRDIHQIEQLQKLIAKRRRMPVLEMNIIHKKKASTFSDQYKRITEA